MSKLVYICYRDGVNQRPHPPADIHLLSKRILPDNIEPNSPLIIEGRGVLIGVFNPVDVIPVKNQSVCLGQFFGAQEDWWKPGAQVPDGTYALFRGDNRSVELVSDMVASRTIWYVKTEELFIAATSQRAIIFFLQSFQPNEDVYPWMLSSGTLGPGMSWDRRIQCLKGDARLFLDRQSWDITIREKPVRFSPVNLSDKQHKLQLYEAIKDTFDNLNIDPGKWILPLSGGVDSRALLLMLKDRQNIHTITWGVRSSLKRKTSDAYIAGRLANYFNVENKYLETDIANEPVEKIFERFLIAGEGRSDHISGYMDGFKIWKRLFETSQLGIIRGDQAFGCYAVRRTHEVYKNMCFMLLSDYCNVNKTIIGSCSNQYRPDNLERQSGETMEVWRDRLNTEFEIPTLFAALNDLKLSYVEIINPLLSKRIIHQVRQLPDHMRTNKYLFKEIVRDLGPNIPYAKLPAITSRKDILADRMIKDIIAEHLDDTYTRNILSDDLVNQLLLEHRRAKSGNSWPARQKMAGIVNRLRKKLLGASVKPVMDINILVFRAYIISSMPRLLDEDAYSLKKQHV